MLREQIVKNTALVIVVIEHRSEMDERVASLQRDLQRREVERIELAVFVSLTRLDLPGTRSIERHDGVTLVKCSFT